jgi:hypothetical protein
LKRLTGALITGIIVDVFFGLKNVPSLNLSFCGSIRLN